MIHYRVRPSSPEAHLFEVELTIPLPAPAGQVVAMAAWIPGSYMIRDFAKNIVEIAAESDQGAVSLERLDKQSWRAAPCTGSLRIRCTVYAWDLSVRGAHLDQTHGYFNGTSLFLRVMGREDEPCALELLPPDGAGSAGWGLDRRSGHQAPDLTGFQNLSGLLQGNDDQGSEWRVATTLPRDGAPALGFGNYRAADWWELIDHPIEMGRFEYLRFEAQGIPHAVALTGRHQCDGERLCADLAKICTAQHRLLESKSAAFGVTPKAALLDSYLFQVMVVGDGYGGLEHRSSTSLLCSRNDLPRPGQEGVSGDYRKFLGLCSHEYFHLWMVKRIRPAAFAAGDLSKEVHTCLLWAFEGITSYYDDLMLLRAGLIDAASYLELVAQNITRLIRTGGRLRQNLIDASFDAWTKFYKQDDNAPNAIVSYYLKGGLVAMALDLLIRRDTAGARSLDDVMRALWERYGQTGIGVPEDGVERVAAEVSGLDLAPFFDKALRGTDELPLIELLAEFGIGMRLRPSRDARDLGGVGAAEAKPVAPRRVLGVKVASGAEARLAHVFDGGAARLAGLSPGDMIVAVNGLRASGENLESLVAAQPEGEYRIHAFRRDELMEFVVTPQPAPADTCELWIDETAEEVRRTRRAAWLAANSEDTKGITQSARREEEDAEKSELSGRGGDAVR